MPSLPLLQLHSTSRLLSVEVIDVASIWSADQASFAVRWETMETIMVCSIFSGGNTDVCASADRRFLAPGRPETSDVAAAMLCSTEEDEVGITTTSVLTSAEEGGCKVVAASGAETMVGDGSSSAAKGPT